MLGPIESPQGVVLMRREDLLARVRADLEGSDLVEELIAERRRAAEREDAESASRSIHRRSL